MRLRLDKEAVIKVRVQRLLDLWLRALLWFDRLLREGYRLRKRTVLAQIILPVVETIHALRLFESGILEMLHVSRNQVWTILELARLILNHTVIVAGIRALPLEEAGTLGHWLSKFVCRPLGSLAATTDLVLSIPGVD